MFFHDFTSNSELAFQFWIIRSKKVAVGCFDGEKNVSSLNVQALQSFLWKYKPCGSADGSQFKFHSSPIPIHIIIRVRGCQFSSKSID